VSGVLLGLGIFLVASAILGVILVRRREQIERRFTLYSSAARWEEALPFAQVLARLSADPQTLGRRQQNLGNVLVKLARWEEAKDAFERALATMLASGDSYAALVRANVAWLELRAGRAEKAREHAGAIERDAPAELKPRAMALQAASFLVEGLPQKTREILEPREAELTSSKKPSDAIALAVLAAAFGLMGDNERALMLGRIAQSRMADAQRREFVAMVPFLAGVLGT
jgi:tetratricopeptide (TPR) repeat protein